MQVMEKKNYKPTICFDFDGVIHRYSMGWQNGEIYDLPVNRSKETIDQLISEGYRIVISSVRLNSEEGMIAVKNWLEKYDFSSEIELSATKPAAIVYVDDRGLKFLGKFDESFFEQIRNFKTWLDI